MICPFCNHDTNPINLNGKSFCENCGLSLGDSPKTTINNTSADSVIPELTTTHHLDTISAENHSERIRPIHENEVHEKVTQSAGINLNQKPPTDDKNIADLSKEPIAAPNPTSDERKISDLSQSIIKKPTEDEFLKELGVNNSDISTTKPLDSIPSKNTPEVVKPIEIIDLNNKISQPIKSDSTQKAPTNEEQITDLSKASTPTPQPLESAHNNSVLSQPITKEPIENKLPSESSADQPDVPITKIAEITTPNVSPEEIEQIHQIDSNQDTSQPEKVKLNEKPSTIETNIADLSQKPITPPQITNNELHISEAPRSSEITSPENKIVEKPLEILEKPADNSFIVAPSKPPPPNLTPTPDSLSTSSVPKPQPIDNKSSLEIDKAILPSESIVENTTPKPPPPGESTEPTEFIGIGKIGEADQENNIPSNQFYSEEVNPNITREENPATHGVTLPKTNNHEFTKKVQEIDSLGASEILLDILDDKAIEGQNKQTLSSYEAAETLLEDNPDFFSSEPNSQTHPPISNNDLIGESLVGPIFQPETTKNLKLDPLSNNPANPIKHLEFIDIKPPADLPTVTETKRENTKYNSSPSLSPSIKPVAEDKNIPQNMDPRHAAVKDYFNNIFEKNNE